MGLPDIDFLSQPGPALVTVVLFGTWQFFGQNVILYLAALKALPQDVLAAASVDGAGPWQRFAHIQWPMLPRNSVLISVITTLTGPNTCTRLYMLTHGHPQGSAHTALYHVFNECIVV